MIMTIIVIIILLVIIILIIIYEAVHVSPCPCLDLDHPTTGRISGGPGHVLRCSERLPDPWCLSHSCLGRQLLIIVEDFGRSLISGQP